VPEMAAPPDGYGSLAAAVEPLLLRARDAARLCGVSPATWHRLVSAGKTPAPVRLAGAVRWRRDELSDWIAAGCPGRREWEALRAAKS
jgi:predicted DNA-binding transcriptional regulator AlpA